MVSRIPDQTEQRDRQEVLPREDGVGGASRLASPVLRLCDREQLGPGYPAMSSPYGKPTPPTRRRTGPPTGAARARKVAPKDKSSSQGAAAMASLRSQQAKVAEKKEALDRRLRLLDRMEADSAAQLATSRRIAADIKLLKTQLAADPPPRGEQRKEMERSLMALCKQARALIAAGRPAA